MNSEATAARHGTPGGCAASIRRAESPSKQKARPELALSRAPRAETRPLERGAPHFGVVAQRVESSQAHPVARKLERPPDGSSSQSVPPRRRRRFPLVDQVVRRVPGPGSRRPNPGSVEATGRPGYRHPLPRPASKIGNQHVVAQMSSGSTDPPATRTITPRSKGPPTSTEHRRARAWRSRARMQVQRAPDELRHHISGASSTSW